MIKRLELLACAMWAKEKCTTNYGIDIDHWINMHTTAKRAWIKKARLVLSKVQK